MTEAPETHELHKDALVREVLANYDDMPGAVRGFYAEYRPLSNYHLESFVWSERVWPASENAYQAAKRTNREEWGMFLTATPAKSKALGKTGTLRPDWEQVKENIMLSILWAKFTGCPIARGVLKDTGSAYLEETNWWNDRVWGVCRGEGQNRLGLLLMQVRDVLIDGKDPTWRTVRQVHEASRGLQLEQAYFVGHMLDPRAPAAV